MRTVRTARRKHGAGSQRRDSEFLNSRLRRAGVFIVAAFAVLIPVAVDPAADWPFTIPKALLTHAFGVVLAGVVAVLVARHRALALPRSSIHFAVAAFVGANVVAAALAVDPYIAVFGTHARMLGLATLASWAVLYFGVVTTLRTAWDLKALLAAALVGTLLTIGYEFVQLARLDPFHWNIDTATRPISFNGQPTTLGTYLTTIGMAVLAVALLAPTANRRSRLVCAALSLVLVAGASMTGTRSALVGLGFGALTLLLGFFLRRASSRRARIVGALTASVGALALVSLLVFTPIGSRLFQSDTRVSGDSEEASIARLDTATLDVRAVLYRVALDAVRARPLFGFGPDNFVVAMTQFRPEVGPDEARLAYATSPHSFIGQIAVGSGLVGLLAFAALPALGLAGAARHRLNVVSGAGATVVVTFLAGGLTTVSDVGSDWAFWIGMGLLAVASQFGDQRGAAVPAKNERVSPRTESWAAMLPALAGLVVALTFVAPWSASRAAADSRDARLNGNSAVAIQRGLDATSRDPDRAEYWHTLALAYVSAQRWRDADAAFGRAIAKASWDARNVTDLVQVKLIEAQSGDPSAREAAVRLSADAIRLDPNFPDCYITRATVMRYVGDNAEALRAIERALVLVPTSTNERWYAIASELYLAVGRQTDAIDIAKRGLALVGPSTLIRLDLARALLATGQRQDALAQVDAVLASDPSNLAAKQLRAEIQGVTAP